MTQQTRGVFIMKNVDSNNFLFDQDPEMIKLFEEEKIKLDIAQHIYDLRDSTGQTQEEFGELVGVDSVIIDDLEEADYEGDSLVVLAHIEKALRRHVEAPSNKTFLTSFRIQNGSFRHSWVS